MKFILGKKLEMTQIWKNDEVIAVTGVQAGPCVITQVKSEGKDGYKAVQVGYGEKKEKNIKKPQKNHLKNLGNLRYLHEFRLDAEDVNLNRGDKIDVNTFESGDVISVTGISKGKGFQGGVRRHGFHGQDKTHGTKDQLRMPGSIGAAGPAHVFKGTRMPGRMGGDQVTTKNLEVVEVDINNNILFIKGAVPGAKNGLIFIKGEGELKIVVPEEKTEEKEENNDTEVKSDEKIEIKEEEKPIESTNEEPIKEVKEVEDKKS